MLAGKSRQISPHFLLFFLSVLTYNSLNTKMLPLWNRNSSGIVKLVKSFYSSVGSLSIWVLMELVSNQYSSTMHRNVGALDRYYYHYRVALHLLSRAAGRVELGWLWSNIHIYNNIYNNDFFRRHFR